MSRMEPIASASSSGSPPDLPKMWAADLAGYGWMRQIIGCSGTAVFRLEANGRPTLFVKTDAAGPFAGVPDEVARLRWLAQSGISCPKVLAEERDERQDWLLMSAVPGRDLASSPDLAPRQIIEIAAEALRHLHALDIRVCPFDQRLDRRIALAQAHMVAGVVAEEDFDDENAGRTAADLFLELLASRPDGEDPVVTHGDACLPNLLAQDGRFTGFVDCARAGIADRHQDLALVSRSIGFNLGEAWMEEFLRRYGGETDPRRLAYYRLLDEFF